MDPITWTTSDATAATFNAEIRDPLQFLLGHPDNPKPALRVRASTTQGLDAPVSGPTWTEIVFDTADVDRGFGFGGSVVIPEDGCYDIGVHLDVDVAVSNKAVRILVNSAELLVDDQPGPGLPVPARFSPMTGNVQLSSGDVITVEAYNDAGVGVSPASVDCPASGWAPVLWVEWVAV